MRSLALYCALLLAQVVAPAQAKDRLLWLVRDLPPFTVFEGTEKGQGVIDQMLPLLIEQMPEYDHSIVRVNRARGLQMLQDPRTFTCDPMLLWTAERAKFVQFSQPTLGVLSSGVVTLNTSQALLENWLQHQQLDLKGLLGNTTLKLGIVAERSYSSQVDEILRQLPDSALSRHYGNDATANLLQMQQLGRLQMVLGYWPELRYLIEQQGGSPANYQFHSIQGTDRYQFMYVGCSDTPLGHAAISHIDQLLPALRLHTLPAQYARWLDPQSRATYLIDSKKFFEKR